MGIALSRRLARSLRISAACVALGAATPSVAALVFSENFNDAGFQGGANAISYSDRFGLTSYYTMNSYNGWTFTGSAPLYAKTFLANDGALVLNDSGGGVNHEITGLTVGQAYQLNFLLSGDNVRGNYSLVTSIDGASILTTNGTVGASGTNAGSVVTALFTARSSSAVLGFTEVAPGSSSPMIDNIQIGAVPEPASWGMMICGFGMLGGMLRRQRRIAAAY